jgi:hypothetical protein
MSEVLQLILISGYIMLQVAVSHEGVTPID